MGIVMSNNYEVLTEDPTQYLYTIYQRMYLSFLYSY